MRLLPIVSFVLALSGIAVVAQVATFSTRLEVVRVDALVTANGRVVTGLRPDDFEILDNGVAQQVDLASFEELPLNVTLALDISESVEGERLEHLRLASHALLDSLTPADQAGLVAFSHAVVRPQATTGDLRALQSALDAVTPRGDTSLVDGVYAALTLGGGGDRRSLLVIFTDGADTSSFLSPERVLESARRSDVTVYAVPVRGAARPRFLEALSELTGGDLVEIVSTRDLTGTFAAILADFRQRYLLSYTPRGVAGAGWHRLEVRVKGRRATVRARAGYMAGTRR
jgi:Ca-activated chloride channel family protein